jgi:glycosyltransferase involved in cell wall biosynthesis
MKISYGITVHNEAEELQKLLEVLNKSIDKEDEVVVCVDGDDEKVEAVLGEYLSENKAIVYKRKLDGNFAEHKNSVIEKSTGDYIFHIDADEYPNEILLQQLKQILEINNVDLIWIPRVNTVDGFTVEDVQRWGWRVTENGWVNYPDYQARVFRRDESIRWTRPLHEYITGCKTYSHLPPQEEFSLYHPKTKEKQEQQNKFYMDNFSRDMLVRGVVKKNFEPISLEYFLNMEVASGGVGKTILNRNDKLKKVKDIVEFYSKEENINLVRSELKPDNWQYFNCMLAEFRHNVEDHHKMGWENMTKEYYESLEMMSDEEIKVFNKNVPIEFDNGFMKHGYHRGYAMIGRLINGKSYIPFYMEENKIYNVPWKNDNKIRIPNPIFNVNNLNQLSNFSKNDYCLTQSSILALMGIRKNNDIDIIVNSKLRNQLGIGDGYVKKDNVEIFSTSYDKFMIYGVKNDDDLVSNYTFDFEGYKFLEPRFYFSRKNKIDDKNIRDWEGIKRFYDTKSYEGYPFSECKLDKWGFEFI